MLPSAWRGKPDSRMPRYTSYVLVLGTGAIKERVMTELICGSLGLIIGFLFARNWYKRNDRLQFDRKAKKAMKAGVDVG